MKSESGRSLIEVVGVLAIGIAMTAGVIAMYNTVRSNQIRVVAATNLQNIAADTKTLLGMHETYDGLSIDYLIKAGALKSDKAPLGDENWSITPSIDGQTFSINLNGLTNSECAYFANAVPTWVKTLVVNGFDTEPSEHCFSSDTNQISFVVE